MRHAIRFFVFALAFSGRDLTVHSKPTATVQTWDPPKLARLTSQLDADRASRRVGPFRNELATTSNDAATLPAALVGRWSSEATHLHADGTRLRERGSIECSWLLDERAHVKCDRRYAADNGGTRRSMQVYTRDPDNRLIEVLTIYADRSTRVLQTVSTVSHSEISLSGKIRLSGDRLVDTRGQMTLLSNTAIRYRNETQESPGRWRVDYEETYTRRR